MVSKSQNAFVNGKQILDAIFIANETIDLMLKSDECRVLYKLDIGCNLYMYTSCIHFL